MEEHGRNRFSRPRRAYEIFAGPGHWNDPDMLVVGRLGWGQLRPTQLTPTSNTPTSASGACWTRRCSSAATFRNSTPSSSNLLSNDEVLAVNQDALGRQAARILQNGSLEVLGQKHGGRFQGGGTV